MKNLTKLFLFVAIVSVGNLKKLPSFIERCKYTNSREISKCIEQRTEGLRPRFAKGIPELKVPPMDPLIIPKMDINTDIGLHMVFTNMTVYGISNAKINELYFDIDGKSISLQFFMPTLHVSTFCDFDVKMPVLTLASSGIVHSNITDVKAKGKTAISFVNKNGKTYVEMRDKLNQEVEYGTAYIYFEKLLGQHQELTETINHLINENYDETSKSINPLIYDSLISIFTGIFQTFWNEHSLEEAFEDFKQ